MKKLIMILLLFYIPYIFVYAQPGRQNNTNERFYFLTPEIGWADWIIDGKYQVCKTTNGGITWDSTNIPASNLARMFFLNDSIGFMNSMITENKMKLLKTSNKGNTWEVINDTSGFFIHFLNEYIGYALNITNNNGYWEWLLTKTIDGGRTWDSLTTFKGNINSWWVHKLDDITFAGGEIDEISGNSYGFIKRNIDSLYTHLYNMPAGGLCFIDSLKGFAGVEYNLLETSNGGLTWNIRNDIFAGTVVFTDSLNGFISRSSDVSKTTDGGKTWVNMNTPLPIAYYYFYDSLNIYARYVYGSYFYRSTDGGLTWIEYPFTLITATSQEEVLFDPKQFSLEQNYPNPFNPSTTINFSIPSDGIVTIKIYDILGKVISTLIDDYKFAGNYSVIFNATNLPSGLYIYVLNSQGYTSSKKMILLK